MANRDWGETIASTICTTSVVSGSLTVDVCLGETSYELGSGQTDTFDTGSETLGELGGVSSENPAGMAGVAGIVSTGLTSSASSEEKIIVFFRKDSIPYTRVEKNATDIFNFVHKGDKMSLNKASIIAKTLNSYEDFKKLFWLPKDSINYEQVIVIKKILENIINE